MHDAMHAHACMQVWLNCTVFVIAVAVSIFFRKTSYGPKVAEMLGL